ncbi:hypothetical protein [Bradyrhizobium sp. USDA 3256]
MMLRDSVTRRQSVAHRSLEIAAARSHSMIRKSAKRFSEKIMLKQQAEAHFRAKRTIARRHASSW